MSLEVGRLATCLFFLLFTAPYIYCRIKLFKFMAKSKTAVEAVTGAVKPPISFKEFSKDPVKGLMFICIIAVGYLYVDIKMSNQNIVEKQDAKIEVLETKVNQLTDQLRKSDSTSSALASKIAVLQQLGKIQ